MNQMSRAAPAPRLGILGGMGPQATLTFYQRILDRTAAGSDQEHIPALIWSDTAIPDRTAAILSGDAEGTYLALLDGARLLEREGCTALAMPCNTAHFFADRMQKELDVPLLNMVRLAVAAVRAGGARRVGILGTDGTLQTGLYQQECAARGMTAAIPRQEAQVGIMSIIYNEVKRGGRGSPEKFEAAQSDLAVQGCDAVIVACTELSVFCGHHGLPERYLDAMDVLVEASIAACGYPLG